MLLNSGDVFAGFTIERQLGEGGMGAVYLARHPRLGKQTALKLLKPELFADAAIRTRFEREADLAAALDHPSIVTVYDRGMEGEHLWMCMQYIDGADAGTVNSLTLPPDKAVQIIAGVADALDYAHGMGVLHRDVKPSNILLARANTGQGERVFLTDFGLARLRAETVRLTQTGMFTATLAFASPEQMTGGDMDGRSDQYSLACTLYWLLTGMAPFDSPNPADIIHGNLQLAPPPLAVKRRGLPPGLDPVLAKAMAKHPGHRYRTCAEFAAAAEHALTAGPPATETTGPGPGFAAPSAGYPPAQPVPPAAGAPGYPADSRYAGSAPVVPPQPSTQRGPSVEQTGGAGALARAATTQGPVDRTGAQPTVAINRPAPPAGSPGSVVEQTGGFGAVSPSVEHTGANPKVPAGVEHTGGIPVVTGARPEPGGAPAGYAGESVENTGATATMRHGGYLPGPPGYSVPPPGYAAPGNTAPPVRRSRAPWIAVAILVPLIVAALIAAVVVVLLGADDAGSDSAPAAAQTSTLEREPSSTAGPGATGPGDSPGGEPGDRTRRLFPTLLPQGSELDGFGFQNARCSRFGPGDQIPLLPDVPVFDEVLETRPWDAIWDCRQIQLQPTRMDYTIISYPDAEAAREVIAGLPAHDTSSGTKSGEPYTAHIWEDAGARGQFNVNMLVSFGTGGDSPRSNSLLFVRKWGPTARQDVHRWWADAPL
ncbi:serine/threonine-protein kinase [Nocardia carnea]|uniref:serine/threonine-protein kinase n=1 Tax=Nocardia carnea TaxID=37328 RepID=UPI0024573800|nr:serine/threonine protein kinase [Nocardia carnea]